MRFAGRKSFTSAHEVRVPFGDERVVCFDCRVHDYDYCDYDYRGDESPT